MKELKYFKQLNEYTSNKDNFEYPTVSYVEENKEVYYTEKEKPYAIYRTTGDLQEVRLFGYDSDEVKNYIDKVTIEETGEVITGNSYTFENHGDHKVYIELNPDITDVGYYGGLGSSTTKKTLFGYNTRISELISISENLFSNCPNINNFDGTFFNCTGLINIPENLFSNNTAVTSFTSTFQYCSRLTSITENLFKYNTAVTSFYNTFDGCTGLTNIPENLFGNNIAVTSFSRTFNICHGLTGSIPENLFRYNTAVTSFYNTFAYCNGLTSIPENLFSNNKAVTSFSGTFQNCRGLTGNTPVDSDGTPIYNRSTPGKEGYAIVTGYTYCFGNCTGLTDYSSIPSGWK